MSTTLTHHCVHCDASVSFREITDGWCDSCGKKIPPSMQDELKRSEAVCTKPTVDSYDEPNARHIVYLAVAVVVVAVSSAVVLLQMV